MSTKKEIIYSIYEKLNITSDDNDFSEEYISSLIDSKRATLLTQRYSKSPWNIPNSIKTEVCLNLEVVSQIDGMSCFGTILRSINNLPTTINIKGKSGPISVRKLDRTSIHINVIPIERLPFVGHNSFISQMVYASYDYDGKLYLVSNHNTHKLMEKIRVSDVWEYPDKAYEFSCKSGEEKVCDVLDIEYPLEASMETDLINMISSELSPKLSIPEDDTNDASSKIDTNGRR